MKNILLLLVLISLHTNLKAQWNWQALPGAPVSWRCDDIYFLNPDKGWATNPYYNYLFPNQFGRVLTTEDGGLTWDVLFDSSQTFIRCVGFTDTLNGWFGNIADPFFTTDTNFLYHTTDGGSTWNPVTNVTGDLPVGICGISVVTDSVIYAYGRFMGPAAIMKTIDKGQTWTSQSLSALASGLIDGYFFNADTGFITGCYGPSSKALILSTYDGGTSWQVRHQSQKSNELVWKISFPSRNIGYATMEAINGSPDTTYFLKTTDGGLTWQEHVFKTDGFYDLQGIGFINDSTGWMGGDYSTPENYKTTDGGNTWTVDNTFGIQTPPYNIYGGYSTNRFRKFGDTLMYACGNTIYKLQIATGISDMDSPPGSISIYPNPTANSFTIKINTPKEIGVVEILNVVGEIVYSENLFGKNVYLIDANLAKGIYFVRVTDDERIAVRKLIVE